MEFTEEQYKEIESAGARGWSLKQMAMYFNVDYNELITAYNTPDSKVKYHFERGELVQETQIDNATIGEAKRGNITAAQEWKKSIKERKLDNYKKQKIFDQEKNEYGQLQALIEKGEIKNLPEHLIEYFEQIDYIRCLFNKYNSKSFIISATKLKWPRLSNYQVNKLFTETLNFFNIDNEVKVEAWKNIYADRLDNMALICIEINDFETARRLTMDAAELRGVGKEQPNKVPDELLDRRTVIYTMKIEQIGVQAADRNELAKFIDCLPEITEKEKSKFRREAMIQDVPFELVEDAES